MDGLPSVKGLSLYVYAQVPAISDSSAGMDRRKTALDKGDHQTDYNISQEVGKAWVGGKRLKQKPVKRGKNILHVESIQN